MKYFYKQLFAFSLIAVLLFTFPIQTNGYNNYSLNNLKQEEGCFTVAGDTHIGYSDGSIFEEINTEKQDFIIVDGDLTQNGYKQEYEQYLNLIADSKVPVLSTLGNHDARHNRKVYFENYIGESTFSFDYFNYHIIVLDSSSKSIGIEQLSWLEEQLKENENNMVITHIPAFKALKMSEIEYKLKDGAKFMKIIQKYSPEMVIFAHTHEKDFSKDQYTKYLFVPSAGGKATEKQDSYGYVSVCVGDKLNYQWKSLKEA